MCSVYAHVKGILREKRGDCRGKEIGLKRNIESRILLNPREAQEENPGVGRTSYPNTLWSVLIAFY